MAKTLNLLESFLDRATHVSSRTPGSDGTPVEEGARLVVPDGQRAVLFADGEALKTFEPGQHAATSATVPGLDEKLTKVGFLSKMLGGRSTFAGHVWYVSHEIPSLRWKTKAIEVRDPVKGSGQVFLSGSYGVKISDPVVFLNTVGGGRDGCTVESLVSFFDRSLLAELKQLLAASSTVPQLMQDATPLRQRLAESFTKFGVELCSVVVEDVAPASST